jgi:sarcosine oxidase subunit gamma
LGPGEWLLRLAGVPAGASEEPVEGSDVPSLASQLRKSLGERCSLVDTSDGYTCLNLAGEGVGLLLQKSSGYDFHPANFGPGRCVQTTFAKSSALVSLADNGSCDLIIRRSFADYLASWLLDAGRDEGLQLTGA